MGAGVRPEFNPADRWEELVRGGMSEQAATATVQRELQTMSPNPPARPQSDPRSTALAAQALRQERGPTAITPDVSVRQLDEAVAAQPNRPRPRNAPSLLGTLAQAGQGAMLGFGDELYGGVRALAGEDFGAAQQRAETQLRRYADDNPGQSLLANAVGGVATGMAAPAMQVVRGAGALRTGANLAAQGAASGGLAAAGSASGGMQERLDAAKTGAAYGAALGPAFGALTHAIKGATRAAGFGPAASGGGVDGAVPTLRGRVQQRLGMETAEEAGARRVLRLAEREGLTPEQLAVRAAQAESPNTLAETLGQRGIRGLGTMRAIGNRAPSVIEETLDGRALDEAENLRGVLQRLTGIPDEMDAKLVAEEALNQVKQVTDKLYAQMRQIPLPANDAQRVAAVVQELDGAGFNVWGHAIKKTQLPQSIVDENGLPTINSLGEAHVVRRAIDDVINAWRSSPDALQRDADVLARLGQARDQVDKVVKAAGGSKVGKIAVETADDLFRTAMEVGDSFGAGVRSAQRNSASTAGRILDEARNPAAARGGVASELMRRLSAVSDVDGAVQSPGPRLVGSRIRRDVARPAFPDDASFNQFREAADAVTDRLQTRRQVLQGSQTLEKGMDVAEFVTDPSVYTDVATGRLGSVGRRLLSGGIGRRLLNQNAAEADAMLPFMLAGADGQMTQAQAVDILRKMQPFIDQRLFRQLQRQGTLGGTSGAGIARRERQQR